MTMEWMHYNVNTPTTKNIKLAGAGESPYFSQVNFYTMVIKTHFCESKILSFLMLIATTISLAASVAVGDVTDNRQCNDVIIGYMHQR